MNEHSIAASYLDRVEVQQAILLHLPSSNKQELMAFFYFFLE
jgi:hypothetical protein